MKSCARRIVLVGRQNVGKSTLFNRLCGTRISIVHRMPGTTLDRVEREVTLNGRRVLLVDTGGLGPERRDIYRSEVERQVQYALERADAVLFVCDVTAGISKTEQELARRLRRFGRPLFVTVNKVDHEGRLPGVEEFRKLGLGPPYAISAMANRGVDELIEAVSQTLADAETSEPARTTRIAIVGQPNVGKSTFVNALAGEERVIVHEKPGTTRDALDIEVAHGGHRIVLVDTAGLRRRRRVKEPVELFSQARALAAIDRSDGILFLVEAQRPPSAQEKRLGGLINQSGRPCVIGFNKWDLVPASRRDPEALVRAFRAALPALAFAPVRFISARTGLNLHEAVDAVLDLVRISEQRVSTGELNRAISLAMQSAPPPIRGTQEGRLLYATQTGVRPPAFVVFVRNRAAFSRAYIRHIEHSLRRILPFTEVPIRIRLRESRRKGMR